MSQQTNTNTVGSNNNCNRHANKEEEETKEALATEVVAAEEIIEIALQLPNYPLKENCKMGAYTSSPLPNAHIEPHNSRKSTTLCQSYVQKRLQAS